MSKPIVATDRPDLLDLGTLVAIAPGAIVTRPLVALPHFRQVIFAMDVGQELTEHRSPMLAIVTGIDGEIEVGIAGERHTIRAGGWLLMPANAPHDVLARTASRFLLTLVRADAAAGA